MRIIWSHPDRQALFSQIQDGLRGAGKACDKNTLTVLLSRLRKKGYLAARKQGRKNLYEALVPEAEYQDEQTQLLIDSVYRGSPWGLVASLVSKERLSEAEFDELQRLLEERRSPK